MSPATVIDFQEAKKKILGHTTEEEPATVGPLLSSAVEAFAFSRLPKLDRIQRILQRAVLNHAANSVAAVEQLSLIEFVAADLANRLPDDALTAL